MSFLFLAVLCLSSALDMSIVGSTRSDNEVLALYEAWLVEHGKVYNSLGEKERRLEIFKDNLRFINDHNSVSDRTYKLGLNRFADLTNDEYRSKFLRSTKTGNTKKISSRYAPLLGDNLPESIDWRDYGAVVHVKNQGSCESSWAFSTIAAVEGINQIVTGNLIALSEQQLVDCDTSYNDGCNGGQVEYAFEFIVNNGGIDSEEDYPYTGGHQGCVSNMKNVVVSIDDYENVPQNNEKALQKAVANQPVAAAIDAGGRGFQLYQSGIFSGDCGTQLDLSVAVVGYGTENGVGYWIVRNSWGANWGEAGYIRMERNLGITETGKCGIAMAASYPIKKGLNSPSLGSPLIKSGVVCDEYYTCPKDSTCCCIYKYSDFCFEWGCCPSEYPFCEIDGWGCLKSKNDPVGVTAMTRTPAKPHWPFRLKPKNLKVSLYGRW